MIKCSTNMFDESKEVKYLKKIKDFQSLITKNFKEIKLFKSLQVKTEVYLERKRASTMEIFVNILNGLLFPQ